jgi:AcrR family transcriptional regulator
VKQHTDIWLQEGYRIFGKLGPSGLKVEPLSRAVGVSKSSFYHHFADVDVFIDELLKFHVRRGGEIVNRFMQCERMNPDLIDLLLSIEDDVFFQRQLRIHRTNELFARCIEDVHGPIEAGLLLIWCEALELESHRRLGEMLLKLTVENFYLRLNETNFTQDWLVSYLEELKMMVEAFSGKLMHPCS